VSARHGGPQVFLMSTNGGDPKRITYKGSHNQTPAFCRDANNPMVAFSGRDGGGWDIFTVSLKTGAYTRLTQGQGVNQDPAFSPDCRMVAFASSRGGIFLSNPEGLNQNLVIKGSASTVRWGQSIPKP
jgi:TolB protein